MYLLINIIIWIELVVAQHTTDQMQFVKLNQRFRRIANGEFFDPQIYPFIVGLKIDSYNKKTDYCTGTLLSPFFVLTAAHCLANTTSIKVFRGDPRNHAGESSNVIGYVKHPLYNESSMVADLCLLKISKPFKDIDTYAVISKDPEIVFNNTSLNCTILGWGKQTTQYTSRGAQLAAVRVKYGPNACELPPDNENLINTVLETWGEFLCPEPNNRMACNGDSGGALICHGYLYGVTSHGYYYSPGMANEELNCGDSRIQTRHVFINKYRNWVLNIVSSGSSTFQLCNSLWYLLLIWLLK